MQVRRYVIALFVLSFVALSAFSSNTSPAPTVKTNLVSGVVSNVGAKPQSFTLTAGTLTYEVTWDQGTKKTADPTNGQKVLVEYDASARLRPGSTIRALSIR